MQFIDYFDVMSDDAQTGPLEITSAELSHTGRYTCTAKNAAGSTHRHIQLTVQGNNTLTLIMYLTGNFKVEIKCICFEFISLEVPVIKFPPSTLDVVLNNPITLPCWATGSPRPTISWQKEGISLSTTGNDTNP